MRSIGLLVVAACSSTSSPSPATDAAGDVAAPSCVKRLPFSSAVGLLEIAVDGTSVLANSYDGLTQVPLDGSAPTSVVSVTPGTTRLAVASYDAVALYALATATATEVRRRDGTILATLPAYPHLRSARMNATDFYLFAEDETYHPFLWRVPRAGGAPTVLALPQGYSRFAVGTTVAAITDGVEHGAIVDLATGDSLETFVSDRHYGMRLAAVGDSMFALTGDYSLTAKERVDRLHPAGAVFAESINDAARLGLFADDRYVYVTRQTGLPPATPFENLSLTAFDPVTLEQHADATCLEFRSDFSVVFDQTNLYGVQKGEGSNYDIVIAPRAP